MKTIIDKAELISVLEILIKNLKERNDQEFLTDTDFYKLIGTDEWDDFQDESIDPDIGSINDDWESLKLLLFDNDRPFSSVDFDRVASILRVVSESISPISQFSV